MLYGERLCCSNSVGLDRHVEERHRPMFSGLVSISDGMLPSLLVNNNKCLLWGAECPITLETKGKERLQNTPTTISLPITKYLFIWLPRSPEEITPSVDLRKQTGHTTNWDSALTNNAYNGNTCVIRYISETEISFKLLGVTVGGPVNILATEV
jgi:hypothetical protein